MGNIKKELLNGVFWSALEKYSGLVINLIITMILARLLTPQEFGVVAIATVIISFLQLFCTMGIGPAIIYQNDLSQKEIDSIFSFALAVGIVLSLLFFLTSKQIASFYGDDQLRPVCRILSIQLLFASANMVPNALMAKYKLFKNIAKRTITLQIICGIASVIAAYFGAGVYALLIAPVFTSIGIFVWNRYYFKVRIDWRLNLDPVKRICSFSLYQFLFEFVNYFSRNLDKLIIGKYLSVTELGFYEKSYRLMQQPLQYLTGVLNPVLQPVLNSYQNDLNELAKKYIKLISFVAMISFPVGISIYGLSGEIVLLLFGERWKASIPVLQILSLSLPLQMIQATSGAIFLVANATKAQFWVGIRNTLTTVAGFIIAIIVYRTMESVAWAWNITLLVNFIITFYILFNIVLKYNVINLYKVIIAPMITLLLIYIIILFTTPFLVKIGILYSFVIKIILYSITTIIIIQLTGQYNIKSAFIRRFFKNLPNSK